MGAPYTLAWYACDLRTGQVAEELRALRPTQAISRRLGAITSCSLELALGGAPLEWESATDPARTLFVAVDELTDTPIWSGIPLSRKGGAGEALSLTAATAEAYLDRRYTSYSATGTDISTIMEGVAAPLLVSGPPFTIDTTLCGTTADYTVLDTDDKTVLSCLQELDSLEGAPEWTVDTVWADAAHTAVDLVLRIRPQIGTTETVGEAVFDLPGCISDYEFEESYERGKGANSVSARGEVEGGSRSTSSTLTDGDLLADGWCLWEHHYSPASGIVSATQLDAHAAASLGLMRGGAQAWTVQAVASQAPRLGITWGLGDYLTVAIARSPRHPSGRTVTARAYAWELDPAADRISPILLEDS
ncbi:hypothetical protein ACIPW5_11510 [Streptomyces sp. NPDC090077]|uniref:hypothetical protein n=1 Tax=Streptomyces sp. NPDC090077 TaxID=3365938 RepID=UPI0038033723